MKPSWSDSGTGLSPLERVGAGGIAGSDASIRPARLDRQLGNREVAVGYVDEQLEQLVLRAADEARETARAQGYSAGWAQGRQAAAERERVTLARLDEQAEDERAEASRQICQLLRALAEAARTVREESLPDWTEVADILADGALLIASSALGRELRSVDTVVADSVRAALRALAEPADAVVYLHPEDAAQLDEPTPPGVRVVSDPSIPPGSLTTLTPIQRLRLDLPAALEAAEEVLRA